MRFQTMISALALAAAFAMPVQAQQSFDASKYPPMAGQWLRIGPLVGRRVHLNRCELNGRRLTC
jgi:hypothetical protein